MRSFRGSWIGLDVAAAGAVDHPQPARGPGLGCSARRVRREAVDGVGDQAIDAGRTQAPGLRRAIDRVGQHAQAGLDRKPTMVLLGQGDLPSQWYFRLKREALEAAREGRPFANPLTRQELRWRS